jgi:hypothetical protein
VIDAFLIIRYFWFISFVFSLLSGRWQIYKERYEGFADERIPSFHYGSHYMSAGTVLYYLLRLEPFTTLSVHLQGGTTLCAECVSVVRISFCLIPESGSPFCAGTLCVCALSLSLSVLFVFSGRFDLPDRLFDSVQGAWNLSFNNVGVMKVLFLFSLYRSLSLSLSLIRSSATLSGSL